MYEEYPPFKGNNLIGADPQSAAAGGAGAFTIAMLDPPAYEANAEASIAALHLIVTITTRGQNKKSDSRVLQPGANYSAKLRVLADAPQVKHTRGRSHRILAENEVIFLKAGDKISIGTRVHLQFQE